MIKRSILISLIFAFIATAVAVADDSLVFDSDELTVSAWHVHYSRHTFALSNPGQGTITITKSTPNMNLEGGFIFFNLKLIPLSTFLSGQDITFEKEVELNAFNSLNVFLAGQPGATITIEVHSGQMDIPVPTCTFTVDPLSITLGSTSTLSWQTTNADSVSIDHNVGSVPLNGSIQVVPTETTTYLLTASGPGGTITAEASVTVTYLPPAVELSANPQSVVPGQSSILSWNSEYAESCVIEPDIGVVGLNGTMSVSPSVTTQYSIVATGPGGISKSEVTVTVADPPPSVELNASSLAIELGQSVTLSWATSNAVSCIIEPGIGSVDLSGAMQVSPSETTTYIITASGPGGTISEQLAITVTVPRPTVSFSASPSEVLQGQNSTLSWSCVNADSVEIDQGIDSVSATDSMEVSPTSSTTYTLTAIGPGGTTTSQVTVAIIYPLPIASLEVSPGAITIGESATLTWSTVHSVSASIDNGIGAVSVNGNMAVSPTETTTYRLTVSGMGGAAVAVATVTVNTPAPMVSIMAEPASIIAGGKSNIIWTSQYADSVSISPGIGNVNANGSIEVSPAETTTYTLTATGQGGTTTEAFTVTVAQAPNVLISTDPETIKPGEAATLTWSGTGAETASLDQGIGDVPLSGTIIVTPEATTNYTITVNGPGGTANATVTVTVLNPPSIDLLADPENVEAGGAVNLSWTSIDAVTCSIEPGVGSVPVNGSIVVTPTTSTTYTLTAIGPGGTAYDDVIVTIDNPKPTLNFSVSANIINRGEVITLVWSTADADTCTLEPGTGNVPINGVLQVTPDRDTIYKISASGPGGMVEAEVAISVIDLSAGPEVTLEPSSVTITPGGIATINWTSIGAVSAYIDNGIGNVPVTGSISVVPSNSTTYTLTVSGPTGSNSVQAVVRVAGYPEQQSEGSFGHQYNDLMPEDSTVDYYDEKRFAIITGTVNDINNAPMQDVSITIHSHPEYGTAYTDVEGRFAIPVEGGGALSVVYKKEGFISAQRKAEIPWNDIAVIEPLQLISEDSEATTITFDGNPTTIMTHQSSIVADAEGARSCTLVFNGDNAAYAVDENGHDIQQLQTISVRATEFSTPDSMPSQLPPTTAYTYCAELSVDGIQRVRFSKPVVMWVDNFLNFAVGGVVPVGYYDRDKAVWVPSENGVVVRLLDTTNDGQVDAIDSTGDGQADDLDADGTFTSEVVGLDNPIRYAPGTTFWRAAISHFTPWDCNWPYGPPEDAQWPDPTLAPDYSTEDCVRYPVPEINIRTRILRKEIPIPGTDLSLHYASNRSEGYNVAFEIEASPSTVPSNLQQIHLKFTIAGQAMTQVLEARPSQRTTVVWNGRNFRGQTVGMSRASANIRVGYSYRSVYYNPVNLVRAFAALGDGIFDLYTRSDNITLWKNADIEILTAPRWQKDIAAGWNLSNHHLAIESDKPKLLKGNGDLLQRFDSDFKYSYLTSASIISTIAGGDETGMSGDGGPATAAQLDTPTEIVFDADGNMFFADPWAGRIRKIDTQGVITTVAGNGEWGFNGDGIPAINASLNEPRSVAVDNEGNIYIADTFNDRIRKVDKTGIITTVVGEGPLSGGDESNGGSGQEGDGIGDNGPAAQASLLRPWALAFDRFGNMYIADYGNHRIRKVDPGGQISTVAGDGTRGFEGDDGPAIHAQVANPVDIVVDAEGNLYINSLLAGEAFISYIRKIDTSGIIRSTGIHYGLASVALDRNNAIYFASSTKSQVLKLFDDGSEKAIAGNGDYYADEAGDGKIALQVALPSPNSIVFGPDGFMYIGHRGRIRKLSPPSAMVLYGAAKEPVYTEANGLGYVIAPPSLHSRTMDIHTGKDIYRFGYDEQNNLISVTDQFDRRTEIQRDDLGVPTAVVSPDGLNTGLTVDGSNHLTKIILPGGGTYQLDYTPSGLLTAIADPVGNRSEYLYSEDGRITEAHDQQGGEWHYTRSKNINGELVARVASAEGEVVSYRDKIESGHVSSSVITDANGSRVQYQRTQSDTGEPAIEKSLSCGTILRFVHGFDPEYNFEYLKEVSEQTPLLLNRKFRFENIYEDSNSDGVPDVFTERTTINEIASAEITHNVASSTRTIKTPENRSITATYNPATLGVESISVPGLHDTFMSYDSSGRLTSIQTHTRSKALTYNARGFLESYNEGAGRTTTFTHDDAGRVTGVSRPGGTPLRFQYDADGNMLVFETPLGAHGFTYNKTALMSGYSTPLSGSYSYSFDKDRNLTRIGLPSGKRIVNTYLDGTLQQINTPEGLITFSYTGACDNKIDSIAKAGEQVSFGYDGNMVTSEDHSGTSTRSLRYVYNDNFDMAAFSYAGGTESYLYDLDGLLTRSGSLTITRNGQNGLPERVHGAGLAIDRGFNYFGELESQGVSVNSNPTIEWMLTWDDNGQISSKIETVAGVTSQFQYHYDAQGRLDGVSKDGTVIEQYIYDPTGVRISETNLPRGISGKSFAYSPEHQVLNAGATLYTYDTDGFLATKTEGASVTAYAYSSLGELRSVRLADNRLIEYTHDPFGRRIAKWIAGAIVEKYLWYGCSKLLAVYDGSDNLLQRFQYADERMPVIMTSAGVTYYLSYDQVGSLRVVSDSAGNLVKRIDYDAFGNILSDSNPSFAMPFGFGGGLRDRDTGLVRIGLRDYDPETGRWTSKDPNLFLGRSADLYGYGQHDPISFSAEDHPFSPSLTAIGSVLSDLSPYLVTVQRFLGREMVHAVLLGKAPNTWSGLKRFAGSVEGGIFADLNMRTNQFIADDRPCSGFNWTSLSDHLIKGLWGGFAPGISQINAPVFPDNAKVVNQIHVAANGSIQDAIDLALDGDMLVLADGTYTLPLGADYFDFKGKNIIVQSANGPQNCTIDLQNSKSGFRFYQDETGDAMLVGLTIKNGAGKYGGAIEIAYASPTIQDCIIINNRADRGGGIYIENASPTIINCTIVKNATTVSNGMGGGIYVSNGGPRIINCTVADNTAQGYGGGLYATGSPRPTVSSSIFWNNRANNALNQFSFSAATVEYSDVQGGYAGAGNIDADPRFVNTAADNYHLQTNSPCIDAGSSENAPDHDIDNNDRPQGWYDMGSDETSVISGATFIQKLIDEAIDGDVVLVPAGTYGIGNRNLNFNGKAITLRSAGGAGGVVIDVAGQGRGVVFNNGEGPDSVLDGITIKNGRAERGGGIYIENASPTIINCTIIKNATTVSNGMGGGIYVSNGAPRIINCTVADNTAQGYGGGLYATGSPRPTVSSSIFWNNRANTALNQFGYSAATVEYSDVQGGYAGAGNIDADPRFVNTAADNYHLQTNSPCIDVGSRDGVSTRDLDGQARPEKWYEMGSDELFGVLPDYWKQRYFGTLNVSANADSDGDGLTNLQEYRLFCANPVDGDSDNDGVNDGTEYNAGTSLCVSDVDADGMSDDWEIHYGLNPMYSDAGGDPDGDGLTNLIEFRWGCLSPLNPDSDGDNLSDGQEDANHDAVRSAGETSPCAPDTDNDGLNDHWELENALNPNFNDASEDPDGDGLTNIAEYRFGCLSPHNRDMDHDGLTDGAEDANHNGQRDPGESDPCNHDSDGDGQDDGCEVNVDPYAPEIELVGDATVAVCVGETYQDRGAIAMDNCDGDLTAGIVVENPVNTGAPGVYSITYRVTDAAGNHAVEVTRRVVVLGADDTVQINTRYQYDEIGRLRSITQQAR